VTLDALLFVLGMPLAAVMLGGCVWTAYLVARRAAGTAPAHVRAAATALVALWLSIAVFSGLAALHLFRISIAAPVWILGAALAHLTLGGAAAARILVTDLRDAGKALRRVAWSPLRFAAIAVGAGLVGARLIRDLVSPPLGWDALVYHLFRPAQWIQEGRLTTSLGPDGWRFFEYFPHAGDVPWAWAMLPVRGDALIAPTGVLVWSACLLGGYCLARALGANPTTAGLAGLAIGFLPASVNECTSGYADNFGFAAFLLTGTALMELARAPSRGRAALAGAGLGLVAAGKLSGLPALALGLAFVAWLALRPSAGGARRARIENVLIAVAAALAVCAPGYLRAWIDTGSPFYPLAVTVGQTTLFAGNDELMMLYAGRLHDLSGFDGSLTGLLTSLTIAEPSRYHEHLGFGPGFHGLVAIGALGLISALRKGDRRSVAIFLVVAAALPFIGLMSPAFLAHRTLWRRAIGRLLLPVPATLAVFGARVDGVLARALWIAILVADGLDCVPEGWGAPAIEGIRRLAIPLAIAFAVAAAVALVLVYFRRSLLGALAAVPIFALVLAAPLDRIRGDLRYRIFAAHDAAVPAFQMHTLEPTYASSFPIWRALDDGAPHRIALAAGWDGIGHNLYRYPLTGSRLQNRVMYIPVSHDGEIFDYMHEEEVYARGEPTPWFERLIAADIDVVVTLHPSQVEQVWMLANPEIFELIATSTEGWNLAFRVHRDRLVEELRAPP
jgi:hypothetical protein